MAAKHTRTFHISFTHDLWSGLEILADSETWRGPVDQIATAVVHRWRMEHEFELLRLGLSDSDAYDRGYLPAARPQFRSFRPSAHYLRVRLNGMERYYIENLGRVEPAYPLKRPNPYYQKSPEYTLNLVLHRMIPIYAARIKKDPDIDTRRSWDGDID